MAKLVEPLRIAIGLMETQIRNEAARTTMSVEEAVRTMRASGMTAEEIRGVLLDDLKAETSRYFGEFKTGVKDAVYGGENVARSLGAKEALEERGLDRMYRWQTNGTNICPDCQERHGEVDTMENWEKRGLPTMFGSRCGENCQCTLVAEDMELEPIKVGQEE